ncbi:hypothetical protein PENSPDRAFT_647877 [Peniophora sp. CONT]|nr:hypothetical protein PENSPDRAFT_647877 [Peniophora sp. CONT]
MSVPPSPTRSTPTRLLSSDSIRGSDMRETVSVQLPPPNAHTIPSPLASTSTREHVESLPQTRIVETFLHPIDKFLDQNCDVYGVRQSALWLFSEWGRTIVRLGTAIYHRLQAGVDCYARIVQFVARSHTEILFQTKLLGWQTPAGWRAQSLDIFSFVVVPVVRCHPEFLESGWSYFFYEESIRRLAEDALRRVKLHLGHHPETRLRAGDHIIGAMIRGFMRSPVLHAFEVHLSTNLTIAADDLHLPAGVDVVHPPQQFTSSAPNHYGRDTIISPNQNRQPVPILPAPASGTTPRVRRGASTGHSARSSPYTTRPINHDAHKHSQDHLPT